MDHFWVKMTYAPIEITENEDGTLSTFVRDDAEQLAQDDAALCCWNCSTPLNIDSYKGECPGSHE